MRILLYIHAYFLRAWVCFCWCWHCTLWQPYKGKGSSHPNQYHATGALYSTGYIMCPLIQICVYVDSYCCMLLLAMQWTCDVVVYIHMVLWNGFVISSFFFFIFTTTFVGVGNSLWHIKAKCRLHKYFNALRNFLLGYIWQMKTWNLYIQLIKYLICQLATH